MLMSLTLAHLALMMMTNGWLGARAQEDAMLADLAEEFWNWQLDEYPAYRNPEADHLESFLTRAFDKRVTDCSVMLERSKAISMEELNYQDQLTLKLLQYQLTTFIQGRQWLEYGAINPLNTLEGVHRLSGQWVRNSVLNSMERASRYIEKLYLLPEQIAQVQDLMETAVQKERTNYNTSMRGVVEDISELCSEEPEATLYYEQLEFYTEHVMLNITLSEKLSLQTRCRDAVVTIQEAFTRLLSFLNERYLPNTRRSAGVWVMQGGTEYYRHVLKWHLSTDLHPERVYNTGLEEVERIGKEMDGIMVSLGYGHDLKSFLQMLKTRPEFYNHTEEEYLSLYETTLRDRIQPRLSHLFNNLDQIPAVTVTRTEHKNAVMASYGASTGTVYINNYHPETRPYYTVLAVALHEGSPGHHLQISMSAQQQNLPAFRRHQSFFRKYSAPFHLPYYTAYTEGWGLYAEYLGNEMGLYNDDPYELFGRYCYEIFRACRLVVDVGIHYKGWTREDAILYLLDHSVMSREEIEIEVDRYITWPGQACAYKIGEMKIRELRTRAEDTLNPNFNIKSFHDAILKDGAVPLEILEDIVDNYITEELTSGSTERLSLNTKLVYLVIFTFSRSMRTYLPFL